MVLLKYLVRNCVGLYFIEFLKLKHTKEYFRTLKRDSFCCPKIVTIYLFYMLSITKLVYFSWKLGMEQIFITRTKENVAKANFPQQNTAMSVLFSISQFAKIEMNNIFQFQCRGEKYTKLKSNIWNPEGHSVVTG